MVGNVSPDAQACHAPLSKRHWNVPASLELNENSGWSSPVNAAGPSVICVVGATLSMFQV